MSRSTDGLVGFLLGAAAGGIAGVLLAPAKGAETRHRLSEGGKRAAHKGKEALVSLEDSVREKGHEMGEAARHQMGAVRGAVQDAKDTYRRETNRHEGEEPTANTP